MAIIIRKADTLEDRHRVFRFRYEIYVEEMKRAQTYADHKNRTIIEPFDETAHIFFAEDDSGTVVGTTRTNFSGETDFGYYKELYGIDCLGNLAPQRVSLSTKFMVSPHLRRGTLAYRLATETYQFGLRSGILFDFIDCNPHLEEHFKRLGYRSYRSRVHHEEYGEVMPLVLAITDLDHLESIDSPWARICREHYPHMHANRHLHQVILKHQNEHNCSAA